MNTLSTSIQEDWIRTAKGASERWPILGSTINVHRLMHQVNGLPYRKVGGRIVFNVREVEAWLMNRPGSNLPLAS